MSEPAHRSAFSWVVVLVCAVYAACFAFTTYAVVHYYGVEKAPGWDVGASNAGWFVADVTATGPAAGRIEHGDRLLSLNGDGRAAVLGHFDWRHIAGGSSYEVVIERNGRPLAFELPMPLEPRGQPLWAIFLICGLAFFIGGAGLALLRPQDPQVRLIGVLLMSMGFATLNEALAPARSFLQGWERTGHFAIALTGLLPFPLAYHFFSRFPTWSSPGAAWRLIQWVLYGLLALVIGPVWVIGHLNGDVVAAATNYLAARPSLFLGVAQIMRRELWFYLVACLVLALVVTARNYQRLETADSRRRIRWVVAGLACALIPYLGMTFAYRVGGWISNEAYQFYYPLAFLAMLALPASIATAVWHEQLFDIRVLVRRGLQYLLARTALRVLLVLPVALLTLAIVLNPHRTVAQILFEGAGWLNLLFIGAAVVMLQSRRRLRDWLDRHFFREAYQQERVLVQLIDEVRHRDSLAEIARLVSARVDSVLHPEALHIFYRAQERSDRFEGHSTSFGATSLELSRQQVLLRIIDDGKAIHDFPGGFAAALPESERQWLERLQVRLIVPIIGTRNRLVGVLLLGARRSDEPYSATDRHLLQGIAGQMGLVYENQHLQEQVRQDADVRRDVLARLQEQHVSLLKECLECGRCYDSTVERCDRDGSVLVLTLPVERTLDTKYRLERALGRGGFGAVFEASDLRLYRQVAAKVMMGSLFGDRTALRRFEREARAAARIDHRHITRVHDYGAVGSGGAYLIMELVAGRTWRAELQRCGLIDPPRAAEWLRQLLEGVQFAHEMGIIHRDLKPENVMIVASASGAEELKVMDFGLAKVRDTGAGVTESVTVAGTIMGTLGYMAPEVLTAGVVDERADLFAIGVMVVETLVGARPFSGQTPQEVLTALLHSDYRVPGDAPEVRALDSVVQRCLAKDPRDRYGSAAELARELVPVVAQCPHFAPPPTQQQAAAPTQGA